MSFINFIKSFCLLIIRDFCLYLIKKILNICFINNCINCKVKTLNANNICANCFVNIGISPQYIKLEGKKIYFILNYNRDIRQLIIGYKYLNQINHALFFANLIIQLIINYRIKAQYICFIPSNKIQYLKKGYNHNYEICEIIAKRLNIKLIPNLITKTKYTKPQSSLSKSKRKTNLNNSFKINQKFINKNIRNLLIFDDITTTGNTIRTIEKIMQKSNFHYNYICLAANQKLNQFKIVK